jgi:hypothetical protein
MEMAQPVRFAAITHSARANTATWQMVSTQGLAPPVPVLHSAPPARPIKNASPASAMLRPEIGAWRIETGRPENFAQTTLSASALYASFSPVRILAHAQHRLCHWEPLAPPISNAPLACAIPSRAMFAWQTTTESAVTSVPTTRNAPAAAATSPAVREPEPAIDVSADAAS